MREERVLLLSGPSGAGKTTLAEQLVRTYPNKFGLPIAFTTRDIRDDEQDGVHYNFITKEKFKELSECSGLLTSLHFNDQYYGYTLKSIEDILEENKIPICVISSKSISGILEKNMEDKILSVVIIPDPVVDNMLERLKERGDSPKNIKKRISLMPEEIKLGIIESTYILGSTERERTFKCLEEILKKEWFIITRIFSQCRKNEFPFRNDNI